MSRSTSAHPSQKQLDVLLWLTVPIWRGFEYHCSVITHNMVNDFFPMPSRDEGGVRQGLGEALASQVLGGAGAPFPVGRLAREYRQAV